jgi:hypothetical protein
MQRKSEKMKRFQQLSGPIKIGLAAAALAIALVLIGIAKGTVPANPLSVLLALLIGGVSWFSVVWAIATAARDVEEDLASVPPAEND